MTEKIAFISAIVAGLALAAALALIIGFLANKAFGNIAATMIQHEEVQK